MKHGEVRNRREETTDGPDVTFTNILTGKVVYQGPMSSCTQTVEERYCENCEIWSEARGLIGQLLGCPECGLPWNPAHWEDK